jgi:CRISPR-associated protein Cmr5
MTPRSHRIAQSAHVLVSARVDFPHKKAYGALAHKLPTLILQNGLAQATGFLLAKGEKEHLALLDDLAQTLRQTGEGGCANGKEMHQTVIAADSAATMRLTRRALETAAWIRRYVQGVLDVNATGDASEAKEGS